MIMINPEISKAKKKQAEACQKDSHSDVYLPTTS